MLAREKREEKANVGVTMWPKYAAPRRIFKAIIKHFTVIYIRRKIGHFRVD